MNWGLYIYQGMFAAAWITRKLALIYVMGFSREVAKALIIDAAAKMGDLVEMFQIQWDMEWFPESE